VENGILGVAATFVMVIEW